MICKCCDEDKMLDLFPFDKRSGKYRTTCKLCRNAKIRADRVKNPGKYRKYDKKRYNSNKEKISSLRKKYYEQHKNVILAKKREYVENNKEVVRERTRLWRNKNKDHIGKYRRKYMADRAKCDPQFKMSIVLRQRLNKALRGGYKAGSAVFDLGCSIEDFILYLESKFLPGMNWDNYGDWELDHITPLSSFDLTDRSQIKQACHYKNLQPLWAKDNRRKSNKEYYNVNS